MKDRKLLNIELGRISAAEYKDLPSSGLVVVLDNIRSAHNVGSAFRTSDSFGIDEVFLCGISAVPPSAEIHKSALGAEDAVPWEHVDDTLEAVRRLKADGYTVVAVEQTVHSRKLGTFLREPGRRYALIFGNEASGLPADFATKTQPVFIPQSENVDSLNLSVAASIAMYHFCQK